MTVILALLGASLFLGGSALGWFLWSLRSGQYEDLDGAASRILFDLGPKRRGSAPGSSPGQAPDPAVAPPLDPARGAAP